MSYQAPSQHRIATARIVAIYSLFGFAWIYGSDTLLGWIVHDPAVMVKIAVVKGSLFIVCTATLLYFLINRFVRQITTAEIARLDSLSDYQTIFNATNEAIFVHDAASGRILDINERMLEIYGYTRDEALNADIGQFSEGEPPYSHAEAVAKVRKALNEGPQVFEWHSRRKSGELFWSEVSLKREKTRSQDRIIAVVRDISERKQSEAALRERENRFSSIFNFSPVAIGLGEVASGTMVEANDAWLRLFGYTREEVIGRTTKELSFYVDDEQRNDIIRKVKAQGRVVNYPIQLRHKSGLVYDIQYSAELITLDAVPYLQVMMTDITDLKLAEQALKKSEYFFKESQKSAFIGSYFADFVADKWESSEVLDSIFGITKDYERNVEGWLDIVHPDDSEMMVRHLKEDVISNRRPFAKEYRIVRKNDGETRWVSGLGSAEFDKAGKILTLIGTVQDITDRKSSEREHQELEHQLLHAQKLESLGVLAGGIAHDFNNILAIIIGHCSMALINRKTADTHIPEIEKAAERAAGLCRQMLAYAGKEQFVKKEVNIGELVDEMITMLKATINQNVVIRYNPEFGLPFVTADDSQIRQVVMNLIINAAEAIGDEQGEVRIAVKKTVLEADQQERDHLGSIIVPGSYVCLEVEDTGCGMSDETMRRIFEPFYTTKFTGRGLGMSAVLGIITAHKGALQLFSRPGRGTTFKVWLPLQASDGTSGQADLQVASEEWQGSGTVLLVEDEEMILTIAKLMLEELGFAVIEATNGMEAVALYQKHAEEIVLVVTDMGMPVMDGYELFRELKKLKPQLPIIISSGFGDGDVTAKIARDDIAGLIGKPYRFDQFRNVLKGVVDGMATQEYAG